jgi:hypothetical protein
MGRYRSAAGQSLRGAFAELFTEKMSNYVSFLLEGEAAKRRLRQLFQSEEFEPANHRSSAITARDHSRAARTDNKQNIKMTREERCEHRLTRDRARTGLSANRPLDMKRDLTVMGLVFALESIGVLLAAYSDEPVLWLLTGSAPLGVLYAIRMFLRLRVSHREGLLVVHERGQ